MKSRHSNAAAASSAPVTACAAPGASRAACTRLTRAQQRLRGDARPVGALAAEQLALDDRHAQAALGQAVGAVLAGGPPPRTITS